MPTRRHVRHGTLALLTAAALSAGGMGAAQADSPARATVAPGPYATALSYVVRFYPRWFTYEQGRTFNRLIGPRRVSPVYRAVVAINDDTLYASGFLDTRAEPVVLTIPSTTVTYSLLVLDAYGNIVQTNIAPQTPGTYAFTGPGWSGSLPPGVTQVALPMSFVTVILRADKYSAGVDEIAQAQQFRRSLRLQTLSRYEADPAGGATELLPERLFSISFRRIADLEISRTPILFLRQLQAAMHDPLTPPLSTADQQLADRFDAVFGTRGHLATRARLAAALRTARALIIARYHSHAIPHHWITFTNIGAWGTNYLDRDAITDFIQYGNGRSTAAYYHTFAAGNGTPLDGRGGRSYVLTFSKRQIPQAKRFWSLTAYLPETIELIPNRERKYVVASYTPGLKINRNGSVSIYMAARRPAGVPAANWLPVGRGRFNVMLRVYGPEGRVAANRYVPPGVRALNGR